MNDATAFKRKLRELGYASYTAYLGSQRWAMFKDTYAARGLSMRCTVCRSTPVELHHHTYVRLGNERLDDVTPLCRRHHKAVHKWLKDSGRIFVEYTHEAVAALAGLPVARKAKSAGGQKGKRKGKGKKKQQLTANQSKEAAFRKKFASERAQLKELYEYGYMKKADYCFAMNTYNEGQFLNACRLARLKHRGKTAKRNKSPYVLTRPRVTMKPNAAPVMPTEVGDNWKAKIASLRKNSIAAP